MAQPRGIGLAPPPAPEPNALQRVGGALSGNPVSVPTFSDNPIGAIGFLLQSFTAGAQGQELPITRIRRAQLQQKQLELQQFRVSMDAINQGVELFSGLDPDDPATQSAINRFTGQFNQTLGEGFSDSFKAALELEREQGRRAIEGLTEHQERIFGICGLNNECIRSVASNASLMAQLGETADQERLPGIVGKFEAISQIVGNEAIEALRENGFSLADLQQLPPEFAFTPEEIRTISRNEQIQNSLISVGFRPPDLERFREERREAEAAAAAFRQPPRGPQVQQLLELKRDAEARGDTEAVAIFDAAIERATTIVGRTPEDVGAVQEAEAEAAGEAARQEAANIASFSTLLGQFEEIGPGAAGIRGLVGSTGAGLLGQLNSAVGEGFSEFVTGASPEEISSVRQRARVVVAQSLTQITGEESGRFTEAERQIANEALRLMEPGASFEQIRGALATAVSIAFTSRDRNEIIAGIEPRFDLETTEGQRGLLEELIVNLGLNHTEAVTALDQMALQRRLLRESGGRR